MNNLEIQTPRLLIKTPTLEDVNAVAEAVNESWTQLNRWLDWAKDKEETCSIETNRENISGNIAKFTNDEAYVFHCFDKASGKFIGKVDIKNIDWDARKFMIGSWMRTSEAGKGYATEAVKAMLIYCFEKLNPNRVEIDHKIENHGSRKVIEKLGFKKCAEDEIFYTYVRTNLDGIDKSGYSF